LRNTKRRNTERNNILPEYKNIILNFSHLAFGEFSSKAFGFLTSVYLARVLGADNFGLLGFVSALSAYVVLFSNFGIEQYASQFLSVHPSVGNKRFIGVVLGTRLILSLILSVPYILFGLLYTQSVDERSVFIFQIMFIVGFSLNLQFLFIASKRTFPQGAVRLTTALFIFLFSFLFIKDRSDFLYVTLVSGGTTFLVFLSTVLYIRNKENISISLPGRAEITSLLQKAAPLGLSALMVQIYYSADIVFLGFTNPGVELGYYTGAYKIILLYTALPALVYQVFLPFLAPIKKDHFQNRTTRMYIGILAVSGLFLSGLSYISADFIIPTVLGSAYIPAIGVFKILLINVLFVFVNVSLGNLLIAWNEHKKYLLVVASGAGANIIANIILIPMYGIYGAAIATVIAEAAVFAMAVYFNQKLFGLFYRYGHGDK
jgi:O-antigen/teichoic acid export membrane protein